jgi:hypothetical protein
MPTFLAIVFIGSVPLSLQQAKTVHLYTDRKNTKRSNDGAGIFIGRGEDEPDKTTAKKHGTFRYMLSTNKFI